MIRSADRPFSARLRLAHALLAHGTPGMPGHLADQLTAVGMDTRRLHDRMGALLPLLEPQRHWFHRRHLAPADEVRAYLLAAVLGCLGDVCCHLRCGGPQPVFVMLPLRRIACTRCIATVRRPVIAADQCDVCGERGVVTFTPFACHQGPALITGDGCHDCAKTLGISTKEMSA